MSFDLAFERSRPEARRRGLSLVARHLTWTLLAAGALAPARQPDPAWISGIYDASDADDVVTLVTDATGVTSSRGTHQVDARLEGAVPCKTTRCVPSHAVFQYAIRGPPIAPAQSHGDTHRASVLRRFFQTQIGDGAPVRTQGRWAC